MPRIISPVGNDDFRSLSPKLFNAGQAGPKYTLKLNQLSCSVHGKNNLTLSVYVVLLKRIEIFVKLRIKITLIVGLVVFSYNLVFDVYFAAVGYQL